MNKHLILIDEQKMILYGLKSFLEASTNWKVLILASEKAELFEKLQNQNIDEKESFVAIIDIKCGDENCFELLSLLSKKIPDIKCIIYTAYSNYGNIVYAFDKRINGFLSKDCDENEIILAIETVLQNKTYIQQNLLKEILLVSNKLAFLTSREKQVLDMICEGADKKEICSSFKISIRTCENYFSQLYTKFGVDNIHQLKELYGIGKNSMRFYSLAESVSLSADVSKNKLTLLQDKNYKEDGVKIFLKNIPLEASVLEVMLHDGEKSRQVSFMHNMPNGKNQEYYNLGYFVYPFLNAGKKYQFDFVYRTNSRKIIDKASINVIPVKGNEIEINQIDNIVIDPNSLICSFKKRPKINLPSESIFCVNVWESNWNFLGCLTAKLSDESCFEPYNFYKDISFLYNKEELKSVKRVFFQFYVQYRNYEWNLFISDTFPFSAELI